MPKSYKRFIYKIIIINLYKGVNMVKRFDPEVERRGVTLTVKRLSEKIVELYDKEPALRGKNPSALASLAFEHFYRDVLEEKRGEVSSPTSTFEKMLKGSYPSDFMLSINLETSNLFPLSLF